MQKVVNQMEAHSRQHVAGRCRHIDRCATLCSDRVAIGSAGVTRVMPAS